MALAEELSYKAASERLYITRTPFLRLITLIEEDLNLVLFTKGRKLELTNQGRKLYSGIAPHYYAIQKLIKEVKIHTPVRVIELGPVTDFSNLLGEFLKSSLNDKVFIEKWGGDIPSITDVIVSFDKCEESIITSITRLQTFEINIGIIYCSKDNVEEAKSRTIVVSKELYRSVQFKNIEKKLRSTGFNGRISFNDDFISRASAINNRKAIGLGNILLMNKINLLGGGDLNFFALAGCCFTYHTYINLLNHQMAELLSEFSSHIN